MILQVGGYISKGAATRSSTALSRISRMLVASTTTNLWMKQLQATNLSHACDHASCECSLLQATTMKMIQTRPGCLSLSVPVWCRKAERVFLASSTNLSQQHVQQLFSYDRHDLFTHSSTVGATTRPQKGVCLDRMIAMCFSATPQQIQLSRSCFTVT